MSKSVVRIFACVLFIAILPSLSPGQKVRCKPSQPPSLDSVDVVHVYSPGTVVFQAADGRLFAQNKRYTYHDANRENLLKRKKPFPLTDLRAFRNKKPRNFYYWRFEGLDAIGRPWFVHAGNDGVTLTLGWTDKGILHTKSLKPGFGRTDDLFRRPPPVPALYGREVLRDKTGGVWAVALDRFWRYSGGEWTSVKFPAPEEAKDAKYFFGGDESKKRLHSGYYDHRLFRDGEAIWLIRSTGSNTWKTGSFLIRCTSHLATIVHRTADSEYLTAVVRHNGKRFALVAKNGRKPRGILRLKLNVGPPLPVETIARMIEQLDDSNWRKREEASKFLCGIPVTQSDIIKKAIDKAKSPEQKLRLEAGLMAISSGEAIVGATLGGYTAAELLFISRKGRQYLQPWADGKPLPLLLVTDGGAKMRKVRLSNANICFDHQGPDGTIYVHDDQFVYRLESGTGKPLPILSLGRFKAESIRLVAAQRGKLCFAATVWSQHQTTKLTFWVDPSARTASPLPGRVIAEGLGIRKGWGDCFPVAVGPANRLWFVKYTSTRLPTVGGRSPIPWHRVRTQLWRACDGKARRLTECVKTSFEPSVWPLSADAAMVVAGSGDDGVNGCFLYDAGKTHRANRLKGLLEAQHSRLLKLIPDGSIFVANPSYIRNWLVRVGDGFFMTEHYDQRVRGGSGIMNFTGIFRRGRWVKCVEKELCGGKGESIACRIVGVDVASGRMLAHSEKCNVLKWIPIASASKPGEVVLERKDSFACTWLNRTSLPRFDGAWVLQPKAVDRIHAVSKARKSSDYSGIRRWDGKKWKDLDGSLCGGRAYADAAGGLWHLRVCEAFVRLADGKTQTIPLDASIAEGSRLTVESDSAVWIATSQSLWRMVLRRDEKGGSLRWKPQRRFSLQNLGYDFAGPWICGKDFYYVSSGKLYHVKLQDLLQDEGAKKTDPAKVAPKSSSPG